MKVRCGLGGCQPQVSGKPANVQLCRTCTSPTAHRHIHIMRTTHCARAPPPPSRPATQALSVEEVRERQNRLARMRALLFYHEAKAKRLKKIKSKEYRRKLKKAGGAARRGARCRGPGFVAPLQRHMRSLRSRDSSMMASSRAGVAALLHCVRRTCSPAGAGSKPSVWQCTPGWEMGWQGGGWGAGGGGHFALPAEQVVVACPSRPSPPTQRSARRLPRARRTRTSCGWSRSRRSLTAPRWAVPARLPLAIQCAGLWVLLLSSAHERGQADRIGGDGWWQAREEGTGGVPVLRPCLRAFPLGAGTWRAVESRYRAAGTAGCQPPTCAVLPPRAASPSAAHRLPTPALQ